MEDNDIKVVINSLTEDYLRKISLTSKENLGIFEILKILYEKAKIKELGIFLTIAEYEPIKTDTLISILNGNISKSTIYRKLSEYEKLKLLIKNEFGYWYLGKEIKNLKNLVEIHKILKNNKKKNI
ncbi:MAG: hypothetical protein ACTSRZ_00020 [Promethearchaeota archaeon]